VKDNIQIIDPTRYEGWDELLLSTPGSSFFHTSSWAKVLKEAYGYSPKYFTEFDGGQISTLIAIMEVRSFFTGWRGVSLPFTDYCEPIVANGIQLQNVIEYIIENGRKCKWGYLELRSGNNFLPLTSPSTTYLGHALSLSRNEEQIFSGFRDSTKRNIKKSIKEGVEVKIDNSFESIKEFYRLNCMTRKNHGLPPQPFSFFKEIHAHIISKGHGFVALASYQNGNIAGGIYFHFGEKALYKYGASDLRYQNLRANNLVMWEAIRWYSKNGHKSLCFGRTEPENQGLIQFKSGWGTIEQQINYYRYDLKKGSFVSGSPKVTGFHNKIFRKIPIPLLNRLGSILYKHVA
jgi:hypothetical protein